MKIISIMWLAQNYIFIILSEAPSTTLRVNYGRPAPACRQGFILRMTNEKGISYWVNYD